MELWQLKCFVTVADELHFARAGSRLGVAQATVSRAIQALEAEICALLFVRDTRNVELTRAGRAFVEEAKAILVRTEASVRIVQRAAEGRIGSINVGFDGASALAFFPDAAGQFQRLYPEMDIDLIELPTSKQIDGLKTGRIDVGLLIGAVEDVDLDTRVICSETLHVAMSHHHKLANQAAVTVEDIANERLLGAAMGGAGEIDLKVSELLSRHRTDSAIHVSDSYLRIEFARAGLGLCIVPRSFVDRACDRVVYRPLQPQSSIDISIAIDKRSSRDTVVSRFVDLVWRNGQGDITTLAD
ncbi:LysR family transcriptional regulator [Burkholderia sp. PU8-34]